MKKDTGRPTGILTVKAQTGIEQGHKKDRLNVVVLSVTLLDPIGVDAGGIIGAAPEEVLLPVVLYLDDEIPAEGVAAAEVQPCRLVVKSDAGDFGGLVAQVRDFPVGWKYHVEEVDQQPLVGRVAEDSLETRIKEAIVSL